LKYETLNYIMIYVVLIYIFIFWLYAFANVMSFTVITRCHIYNIILNVVHSFWFQIISLYYISIQRRPYLTSIHITCYNYTANVFLYTRKKVNVVCYIYWKCNFLHDLLLLKGNYFFFTYKVHSYLDIIKKWFLFLHCK